MAKNIPKVFCKTIVTWTAPNNVAKDFEAGDIRTELATANTFATLLGAVHVTINGPISLVHANISDLNTNAFFAL